MGAIIQGILAFLGGEAGKTVGRGVSWAALVAAITPAAISFLGHKDEIAVSFTWMQLALASGFVYGVVELVRRCRAP